MMSCDYKINNLSKASRNENGNNMTDTTSDGKGALSVTCAKKPAMTSNVNMLVDERKTLDASSNPPIVAVNNETQI